MHEILNLLASLMPKATIRAELTSRCLSINMTY